MAGSNLVQSVLRGTEIVEIIAQAEGGLTLNEVSVQVGLKTTTAYNIIRTLCAAAWLERDPDGKYFIGSGLVAVVRSGNSSAVLAQAVPLMLELKEYFPDGTFTFSEFTDDGIWCRLRLSPERPGMIQRRMLQRFRPYVSATGILFQAFLAPDEFSPVTELYPFYDYGHREWNNPEEFEKHLEEVRTNGYAVSPLHSSTSIALAFPVMGKEDQELHYALGISFGIGAYAEKSEIVKKMQEATKALAKFV
ncbi:MAG: IclR family transcriptional regulator C-terminal domain-containing protein [Victivallaceae bacterium]|nr:IclR family transcriptional regulator C-terminal domain-containing protein [Victivallaceae bacterium]